jgi:hypothetical protein
MSFKDEFNEALRKALHETYGYTDVAEVVAVEESTYNSGFCETCWDESIVVYVYVKRTDGTEDRIMLWESMSQLIKQLSANW